MSNLASSIKIENFKSIKFLELSNCKRINLFIGHPNVGKSNILEAISLFCLPHFFKIELDSSLKNFIRIEENSELFFYGDKNKNSTIKIDKDEVIINPESQSIELNVDSEKVCFSYTSDDLSLNILEGENLLNKFISGNKKSYWFPKHFEVSNIYSDSLIPIHGENLFRIIQNDNKLKKEIIDIFKNFDLTLVFDKSRQELKIMKTMDLGEIFLLPFSLISDSLQRLIFFKTAIYSNKNSIITFEEPEAHTYPPYISQIAQDIVDSETNQFFITTHSPYVVNKMLESAQNDLAIFLIDFKEGQTIAKCLSEEELNTVYNDGIDLFFNNEFFLL